VHELAITQEVVAMVAGRVGDARVSRVVLEIGKLAAVLPDAVRFCFDACIEGTALEGAALDIVEVPGVARCRSCAGRVQLDRPYGRCRCGSSDLDWLSGDELKIARVEVR
jgi:hydrogenase nickel incorporation protein HypA/HybF